MGVSRLQKGNAPTQVCIFCALRFQAPPTRSSPRWHSFHSSSTLQRPYEAAASTQDDSGPRPLQSSQRGGHQHAGQKSYPQRSSSQRLDETRNHLQSLFQSASASNRLSRPSPNPTTGTNRPANFDGYRNQPRGPHNPSVTSQTQSQSLEQPRYPPRIWRSGGHGQQQMSRQESRPERDRVSHRSQDGSLSQWGQLPRRARSGGNNWDAGSFGQRPIQQEPGHRQAQPVLNDFVSFQPGQRDSASTHQQQARQNFRGPPAVSRSNAGSASPTVNQSSSSTREDPLEAELAPIMEPQAPVDDTLEVENPPLRSRLKAEKSPSRRDRYEARLDDAHDSQSVDSSRKKGKQRATRRDGDDEEDAGGREYIYDEEWEIARQEKRKRKQLRKLQKTQEKPKASGRHIVLPEFISIGNLASALKVRVAAFEKKLVTMGFADVGHAHIIDGETAGLIASEFDFDPIIPSKDSEHDIKPLPPSEDTIMLMPRPPIITIMGHVDHGKTTLLDWLRKSSVAATEHGGITQHIGAFTVSMPSGRLITFLDTPGHAAFLDMRARGANVTDIVILVVAADDSVKPQTIEAIKHAKAAKVPIIVAINKMDKEDANPERVKQDLSRQGIDVEDFGGDVQTVCVSGKTGLGMEDLEESAIALADILDVKADTTGQVEGWVLEATSKKSGKVATVLVRRGTLRTGDVLVAGETWGRVKTLRNEAGILVDFATPSTPVEVDGWREPPDAGAEVLQAPDEQRARRAVEVRVNRAESEKLAADVIAMNEARRVGEAKRERLKAIGEGKLDPEEDANLTAETPGLAPVPFVLRADVSGSVEAVQASVLALGTSEIRASVLRSAFGPLSETDIELAAAAGGHAISFNQPVDGNIKRMAEKAGVRIIDGNIIYRLTDEVKGILEDRLPPLVTSRVTGEAEVAQVFEISLKGRKKMPVAGCRVRNGVMAKGSKVKILRGQNVVYDGLLTSLKNQKKDVTEMRKGTECGLGFEDFVDFRPNDQVQCYETIEEKRKLY